MPTALLNMANANLKRERKDPCKRFLLIIGRDYPETKEHLVAERILKQLN